MHKVKYQAVVIGGSWGGFDAIAQLLNGLSPSYSIPMIIVLHRLKGIQSNLVELLQRKTPLNVKEIDEKEEIKPGTIYIAPANYHVLIEDNFTFSLDVSDAEKFSRPSIDVTFQSASLVYKEKLVGIIISGANSDGSNGLAELSKNGGRAIIQDPDEAEIDTMPRAAIIAVEKPMILKLKTISELLNTL